MPEDGETIIVPPATSLLFSDEFGEVVASGGQQDEQDERAETLKNAKRIYVVVHSQNPSHCALLEVHKGESERTIEYRDSVKPKSKSAHEAATRAARRLQVLKDDELLPEPCNVLHQVDGRSCG